MRKNLSNGLLGILKLPLYIIRYFCIGLFLIMYYILSFVVSLLEYAGKGMIVTFFVLRKVLYYFLYGVATPLLLLFGQLKKIFKVFRPKWEKYREEKRAKAEQNRILKAEQSKRKQQLAEQEEQLRKIAEERKQIQEEEIKKAKAFIAEEKAKKREESQNAKKKIEKEQKEAYINKDVKLDRRKNSIFAKIIKKTGGAIGGFFKGFKDNQFTRYRKNKKDLNRQVLLINFEGEDAKKNDTKILYEYVAKDPEGNVIKGYSEAYSRVEVHSYLLSEGFEVYSIKTNWWIRLAHSQAGGNKVRFKTKDLIFFLTQLSTYLKAGITLVEALRILSRQYKKKSYQRILKAVVYDLTMGDNLSDAMDKQNVAFPKLLINMVKTAEMTGELPEVLDDMVEYYTEMEQTRKQMITALTYPTLVFVFAVAVITFMLVFVIPQFTNIYTSMDNVEIPVFTQVVMSISDFLRAYSVWILISIIVFCVIFVFLYKKIRGFRTIVQWTVMHIPVIGDTIIYNEVTTFTKTFSSLLSHSVFITDSMDILNKITNNEIYKMIILDTITNLAKGDKISAAFKDHWAFPLPAYEMLVTGETTGELPEMMRKVSTYYQMLHKDSVTRLKTFIEPVLTIFLTVIVGIIILAIIIPMFGMYNSIQQY